MQTTDRFRINEKLVTSKIIDGEAIIINLSNGMYYSLDKTGAVAWLLLGGSHSLDECAAVMGKRFAVPATDVRKDLDGLVNDLVRQNLIMPAEAGANPATVALDPAGDEAYETPVLNTYDDMGDVLALDPPLPQVEVEIDTEWDTGRK